MVAMFAIVELLFFFLWYAKAASFIAYNDYDRRATSLLDAAQRERERTVVLMYHKPPNVITSHSNSDEVARSSTDPNTRRTVYENIYSMKGFISGRVQDTNSNNFADATKLHSKIHAVGRLDVDTTGLLLLTNDGALVHRTTNPTAKDRGGQSAKKLVQKTYEAVIMGNHKLDGSPLQQLIIEGVDLGKKYGGQTKPVDDLTILSHPSRSTTLVSITISEGKNRQVRRMFHAVGSGVMQLHRVSVGKLTLKGLNGRTLMDNELKQGEWRLLTQEEIEVGLGWKCRCLDDDFERGKHKVPGKIRRRRKVKGTNRKARR